MGDVPESWEVKKLKYLGKAIIGLTYKPEEVVDTEKEGILVLRSSNIQNGELSLGDDVFVNTEIPDELRIRVGDILICARNGSRELVGKNISISNESLVGSTFGAFMTVYRTPYWRFISKVLSSIIFKAQSGLFSSSTINQLTSGTLNSILVPIPKDAAEQLAIAHYLDRKTAQLDQAIAEKERLIELFREERQAIINHAVTKGIRAGVKMKPSGVEWIGEVPEGWAVKSLHWLLREPLKYGANEPAEDDDPTQPRYIRITDFGDDGRLRDETFKSLPIEKAQDYFLAEGDILFARSGATVGKTFQFKNFEGLACFAGYLIKASADSEKILSDFLYYFTKSNAYENWKNSIFNQATIQNIGADKYRNLPIPLTSIAEQLSIVTYLDQKTAQIDTAISGIQQETGLLREYRQALIFEAVTGKIKIA